MNEKIIDLDALMGKELNDVVCAAYKMGCDQTREVYQKRIEKLEAALRIVINWDSTFESKDGLDWGEVMDIASKALEGKDGT
jgi:hypothetical protein